MISEYLMSPTADILPSALVQGVDPNVVVQSRTRNLNVKWIVRGNLWSSLATSCERGDRTFCGSSLPNGLHRFQKLDVPLFTPTTEAERLGGVPRERNGRAGEASRTWIV